MALLQDQRISLYVLCLSVSCFLQVLGFVLPGWGLLKGDLLTIHVGLWYRVTCKKEDGCKAESMITGQSKQDNDMLEYQIESSIALAACVIAIITLVIHVRHVKNNGITIFAIGMLASSMSGVLALLASSKMGYKYQQRHKEQIDGYGKSVYNSPYSLFLTGNGGMIACLITFVMLLEIHLFVRNIFSQCYAINKELMSSEQTTVAMATPYAPLSASRPNEGSFQNSSDHAVTDLSTNENLNTSGEHNSSRNENTYMYAWPSTKESRASKPLQESRHVVNSTADDGNTDDVKAEPAYGNVVLANGQHFVRNDTYDM